MQACNSQISAKAGQHLTVDPDKVIASKPRSQLCISQDGEQHEQQPVQLAACEQVCCVLAQAGAASPGPWQHVQVK